MLYQLRNINLIFMFSRVKMDKELPSEILARIASNLSLKDLNSLLRTSKNAHWKLEKHRNMLTKAKMSVVISRDSRFPQYLNLEVQHRRKHWTVKLNSQMYEPLAKRKRYAKDPNETLVEKFYYENMDNNCLLDQTEGIALHLKFLLSRVNIENISLVWLLMDEIQAINNVVSHSSAMFGSVKLFSSFFKQCHQDLIIACNPQELFIRGAFSLPDNFYQLKVIQKLHALTDYTEGHNNIDIFSLPATDLVIRRLSNIDFSMVLAYLKQWTESKRNIVEFKAEVKLGIAKRELETLISICQRELVYFSFEESEEGFSMMIHRRQDNATVYFSRRGTEVAMKNPNPSLLNI